LKVTELGKSDIEKYKNALSAGELPKKDFLDFEQDSAEVDGIEFLIAKPKGSSDPSTEIYMLKLTANQIRYSFTVRQTRSGNVALSMSTIGPRGGDSAKAEVATYSVTDHKITKMKAVVPLPPGRIPLDLEKPGMDVGKTMAELLAKLEPA
jgi:hypothetical protein